MSSNRHDAVSSTHFTSTTTFSVLEHQNTSVCVITFVITAHCLTTSNSVRQEILKPNPNHYHRHHDSSSTMTTTSLFTVSGFFAIASGNHDNKQHHTCYDTTLSCITPPAVPAQIFTFNPGGGPFLPDETIIYALGKIYYPPPSDCHPAIIDAILFAPFPGDPMSRNYTNGVPDCPHPTNCCTRHCLFSRDT